MRYADMMGGRPEVQEWEIAVLHRARQAPEGAVRPGHLGPRRPRWSEERVLDAFRMTMVSRMEELPGFCSVSVLVDRETGRSSTAVVYESRDAMYARDRGPADARGVQPARWASRSPRWPSSTSSSPTCGCPRRCDSARLPGRIAAGLAEQPVDTGASAGTGTTGP